MTVQLFRGALLAGLLSAPAFAQAHYLPGAFPLQGETTMAPYPGVYFSEVLANYNGSIDLNRSLLRGRVNANLDFNQNVFAACNVLMWQTGEKFLGADYGISVIAPVQNLSAGASLELGLLTANRSRNSGLGLGDVYFSPLMLGWHGDNFDALFSYGIWAPTGRYSPGASDNIGRGFATHMLQLGGSYYLDDERSWSLNAVGTFEASTSNAVMNPGNYFTLDWGIMKKLDENWRIGLTGYNTRQLTPISGLPNINPNFLNSADAIGAEVGVTIPEANYLGITLKFSHEYSSFARFGGNMASLTFSVPIEMQLPTAPPPAEKAAPPAEPSPEVPPAQNSPEAPVQEMTPLIDDQGSNTKIGN